MLKKIKNIDFFGAPVPTFNIGGKTNVPTWLGSIISILILGMTFMFGLIKIEHMAIRKNPEIIKNIEIVDIEETYDTG